LVKFKAEVKFNQSIHDPLTNPNTKAKKNTSKNPQRKNLFDDAPDDNKKKFNPLALSSKPEPIKSAALNS
jgi:hypothetical protein